VVGIGYCPAPEGLQPFTASSAVAALLVTGKLGQSFTGTLRLTHRSFWPVIASTWEPGPIVFSPLALLARCCMPGRWSPITNPKACPGCSSAGRHQLGGDRVAVSTPEVSAQKFQLRRSLDGQANLKIAAKNGGYRVSSGRQWQ